MVPAKFFTAQDTLYFIPEQEQTHQAHQPADHW